MTLRPFLRMLLVCAAFALGSPAAFALDAADTAALAGDDFDAKLAAIDHLAAAGDAASVGLLHALADGTALASDDGKLLLQADDGSTKDALSGAAVQPGDA
ncbi:urea ABC transporter permease subunit UrtB, partial [Burkholderia gladioli]|nr:urea ABC transporter permease subunit UrtB [Burkholderia gladioli]